MSHKPVRLQAGDQVGILLPSSPIKEPFRSQGLAALQQIGYQPVECADALSQNGFAAKTAAAVLEDMRQFFRNDSIKALWAGRGGYGANYILPFLGEFARLEPKIVIGCSDVSYLLWGLLDQLNWVVFYGPMVYGAMASACFHQESLRLALSGDYQALTIPATVLKAGRAQGILSGGCLSNFVSLIGTPYMPNTQGRIILLEDVNEKPYRLDRLFWQLEQSNCLHGIAGLVLGEFPDCFRSPTEKDDFLKMILAICAPYSFPILYDMPLGHSACCHTVPLGVVAEINTACAQKFMIAEKGVRV